MANAIRNAKHEVFITDWWLTPEVYLVRDTLAPENRLDQVMMQRTHVISMHAHICSY